MASCFFAKAQNTEVCVSRVLWQISNCLKHLINAMYGEFTLTKQGRKHLRCGQQFSAAGGSTGPLKADDH